MKAIECAHGQARAMSTSKIGTNLEGFLGHSTLLEKAHGFIRDELGIDLSRLLWRQGSAKLMLRQGVGPFSPVEGCEEERRGATDTLAGF